MLEDIKSKINSNAKEISKEINNSTQLEFAIDFKLKNSI